MKQEIASGPSLQRLRPLLRPRPLVAQDYMQSLPPIYTALVDMHRKSPQKFARDHAECRELAAPHERAARDAMA